MLTFSFHCSNVHTNDECIFCSSWDDTFFFPYCYFLSIVYFVYFLILLFYLRLQTSNNITTEVIAVVIGYRLSDWVTGELLKKHFLSGVMMFVFEGSANRLDVSGLVAGILAVLVSAVIATVLGVYCYKAKKKGARRSGRYVCSDVDHLVTEKCGTKWHPNRHQ